MTKEKLVELKERLKYLRTQARDDVANQLDHSRKEGASTAEDSAYGEILDRQRHIEEEIVAISNQINLASIIKVEKTGNKKVDIGSELVVEFNNIRDRFKIVGELEADPLEGKISNESPVGKSLIGKVEGDIIEVQTPVLTMVYKILEII